jgi:hypothetical protein
MRKLAVVVVSLALAATAAADPARGAQCKRVVVGKKQGERKVICAIEAPLVVHARPPRPGVAIVAEDGKKTVGRPRSTDALRGLPQHLRD